MTETATPPPKQDPEALMLRARPQPVTRINKRVLMGLAGLGASLIFAATIVALDPPTFREAGEREELYNISNKPMAEGLSTLPTSYGDVPPKLDAPRPGNIGGGVVDVERQLGLESSEPQTVSELPFRPNPEDDALRAERIRQARLAQQGRESAIFFHISSRIGEGLPQNATLDGESALIPAGRDVTGEDIQPGGQNGLNVDLKNNKNLKSSNLDLLPQPTNAAIYNPHALEHPTSPYQIMAGTIIPASLITGINSDLPGLVIAQVTENVYDTVSGQYLLVPQGTRLIGTYDNVIAFGQERALVIWKRIIMPDGSSIVIENTPAADTQGYGGLEDKVDFHTWRLLKGIVLSTLLGVGSELTFGQDESDLVRALREAAQDTTNQVGRRITEHNLNIQPTITIRPGWPLRVIVNKDLVLRPYAGRGEELWP